jgi:patatin-related protein
MTDFYGYDRQVSTSDPTLVHDRRHRHVFEFAYGEDEKRFASQDNLALAFAARATSCFPGAFPPVSIPLFRSYLPEASGELEQTFFRLYELSGAEVEKTYFVDGGVLDNRPFGYAVDAIKKKRAEVEVERRLLYLEPDPGAPTPAPAGETPGTISAVLGAVSGIPRREPILDDLLEVARLNERVRRMQDVIVASFGKIADRLDGIVSQALEAGSEPDAETLAQWQRRINEDAVKDAGMTYETYVRSKISGVVDRLATTACAVCTYPADANHAFLVRSVYRHWAEAKSLFRQDEGVDGPSRAQLEFLRDFDLDYGIRRLQFVLAGVNWLYRDVGKAGVPPRAELDAVKARLWEAIDRLRDAMSGRRFTPELDAGLSACFPVKDITTFIRDSGFAPAEYVAQREEQLDALERDLRTFLGTDLKGFSAELYRDMTALTAGWDPARRRDMLVRYLGFPFWDILLYPIQSVAEAGERDEVKIVRMSPLDTDLLRVPDGKPKLEGIGINHFKAFFAREYRENDYLWGRLDAAERLIGIVIGKDDPAYRAWCARAFAAILDEEGEALTLVPDLVESVRGQAAQLAG